MCVCYCRHVVYVYVVAVCSPARMPSACQSTKLPRIDRALSLSSGWTRFDPWILLATGDSDLIRGAQLGIGEVANLAAADESELNFDLASSHCVADAVA